MSAKVPSLSLLCLADWPAIVSTMGSLVLGLPLEGALQETRPKCFSLVSPLGWPRASKEGIGPLNTVNSVQLFIIVPVAKVPFPIRLGLWTLEHSPRTSVFISSIRAESPSVRKQKDISLHDP